MGRSKLATWETTLIWALWLLLILRLVSLNCLKWLSSHKLIPWPQIRESMVSRPTPWPSKIPNWNPKFLAPVVSPWTWLRGPEPEEGDLKGTFLKKQLICFISLQWPLLWWLLFTMACPALRRSWYVGDFHTINLIRTSSVINRLGLRGQRGGGGCPSLQGPRSPFAYQFVAKDIRMCSSCPAAPGSWK